MFVSEPTGIVSVRAACSTAWNGPISPPVGVMTPIAPAIAVSGALWLSAKTNPAITLRTAPTMRVRRRPIRSAAPDTYDREAALAQLQANAHATNYAPEVVRAKLISRSPNKTAVKMAPVSPACVRQD